MNEFIYGCVAIVVITAISAAAAVGISRAEAARACFEAAKVNPNITCAFKEYKK